MVRELEDPAHDSPVEAAGSRERRQRLVDRDGDHRSGDAHGLCQRYESAVGPRGGAPTRTGSSSRVGCRAGTHCPQPAGRKRDARPDGRRTRCGGRVCRPALARGDWPGQSAALERNLRGSTHLRVYADAFGVVGAVSWTGPGLPVRRPANFGSAAERGQNSECQPRAASRPQRSGGCASGYRAGAASERRADDPHGAGLAHCGAGVHRRGASSNRAHLDSVFAHSGAPDCDHDPTRPGRQAEVDTRGDVCWICERGAYGSGAAELGQYLSGGKTYPGDVAPLRRFENVSPGFLHTMGARLTAGREFIWTDIYGLRPMVMVSENLAREFWGTPSAAVGKRLRQASITPWQEVIGVVQDVRQNGIQEKAPEIVYWPVLMRNQFAPNGPPIAARAVTFVIRSERAGTGGFLNQVRQAVWSRNASLPLASVRTMREIYDESLATTSFTLVMLGIAGGMAMMLGLIGIYGVISYVVSQRTREIGIRVALGAEPGALRWLFVRYGLALAGAGTATGLAAAAGLTRLMKSVLFGISPVDPLTYMTVPVVLIAATVLASYLPARRAAAVDPVETLRAE